MGAPGTATPPTPVTASAARAGDDPWGVGRLVALGLIGLFCGLSPLYDGLFDLGLWAPCALVVLAALVVVFVAGERPRGLPAWLLVGGLTALAGWAWLSTTWADAPGLAEIEAARYFLYAAVVALLASLVRGRRAAAVLLGGATVGVLVVAVDVLAGMLFGDGPSLFIEGRLNGPLGYVNGEAAAFLLAFWPLVAVAEHVRRPLIAAPAAGLAAVLASLIVLSQSRGAALGAALGVVVLVALAPGRQPRVWLLLVIAAVIALAGQPVVDLYGTLSERQLTEAAVRSAAGSALLVGVAVALVWGAAGALLRGVGDDTARTLRRTGAIVLAVGAVLVVIGGVALSGRIADKVSDQYDSFVSLGSDQGDGSRLTAGGGNRHDFWRVALNEFSDHPVEGVGAGNYPAGYYLDRRQDQDVSQPHSLPLQVLSELGIVGGALLLVALVGATLGLWRRARGGPAASVPLAVAAGGAFLGWLGATSVDWVHLFPGLAVVGLGAAAVLVDPAPVATNAAEGTAPARRPRLALTVAVTVLAALAAFGITRIALADRFTNDARTEVVSKPLDALLDTSRALSLDGDAVDTYYVRAAAYARLGRYTAARAALTEGLRRDPDNFVTWTLLGDLAFRRGDLRAARASYARAAQLNPLNIELRRLARNPAA